MHLYVRLGLCLVLLRVCQSAKCSCANSSWCIPANVDAPTARPELFAFQVNPSNWQYYPWDSLTTVALFGGVPPPAMICHAHENGVRVVNNAPYPPSQLGNSTFLNEVFIPSLIAGVEDVFADGVNFDFEDPLTPQQAPLLTEVVSSAAAALKTRYGAALQVTIDVAWSPNCIDGRCYDYKSLSDVVDFSFVMAYDMRSQVFLSPGQPCLAGPNAPLPLIAEGLANFTRLGIPSSKLVLGVPWYGYVYPCEVGPDAPTNISSCEIASVPFRGVNCSDAAGREYDYWQITALASSANATTPLRRDVQDAAVSYNFVGAPGQGGPGNPNSTLYQVWFDDPTSLSAKYSLAKQLNLRGVGMWNSDTLKYGSTDPVVKAQTKAMWDAVSKWFESDRLG